MPVTRITKPLAERNTQECAQSMMAGAKNQEDLAAEVLYNQNNEDHDDDDHLKSNYGNDDNDQAGADGGDGGRYYYYYNKLDHGEENLNYDTYQPTTDSNQRNGHDRNQHQHSKRAPPPTPSSKLLNNEWMAMVRVRAVLNQSFIQFLFSICSNNQKTDRDSHPKLMHTKVMIKC